MKKLLLGLFIVILSFGFAQKKGWQTQSITWNSGSVASDTLITTGADTSDWFTIPSGSFNDVYFPETLSFLVWGDAGAAADSTDGVFTFQLSNDKTYITDYGTFATLPVGTADPNVTKKVITDMPLLNYGRIIITAALAAGDSSMFGAALTKDFSNY